MNNALTRERDESHLNCSAPIKNKKGTLSSVFVSPNRQQNPMLLFPNDGCLCRLCVMVSRRDGCWLTLVRLHQLSGDSSGGGSFAIGSGAYLWLPLFSFALLSGCGVLFVIFFFPLIQAPPPHFHVYLHKPVLFTMEIFFCEPWP